MFSTKLALICFGTIAGFGIHLFAQQPPPATPPDQKKPLPENLDKKAPPAAGTIETKDAETIDAQVTKREKLEKEFQETLTNATLQGIWQMTGEGGLKASAPLTEPKPDKYTIISATKSAGDNWIVNARIQFADKDVTFPFPIRVVWAEDTAIITLNDLAVPMVGTYSARVMIHKGFYSGIWYCNEKNYGGVMQGRIIKTPPPVPQKSQKEK